MKSDQVLNSTGYSFAHHPEYGWKKEILNFWTNEKQKLLPNVSEKENLAILLTGSLIFSRMFGICYQVKSKL